MAHRILDELALVQRIEALFELLEAGDDYLRARMPVRAHTRQPAGMLHGGASVALAETLASWAATFCVDPSKHHCVGIEINANHLRPVAEVRAERTARLLSLDVKTAAEHNAARDAARSRYVRATFGAEISDPTAYDLVINSAQVPTDTAVELIAGFVRAHQCTVAALAERGRLPMLIAQ